jgi:hypothetical protein
VTSALAGKLGAHVVLALAHDNRILSRFEHLMGGLSCKMATFSCPKGDIGRDIPPLTPRYRLLLAIARLRLPI